jgi:hypothetical protein
MENALLDGSSGEAMHKDLHRIALCSTGGSFRFQASTMRLEQNLSEYDLMCNLGMAKRFNQLWYNHKAVLQRRQAALKKLTPLNISFEEFWQRLYRYGLQSVADWSELGQFIASPKETRSATCSAAASLIKKDFLKVILHAHDLYSG